MELAQGVWHVHDNLTNAWFVSTLLCLFFSSVAEADV